MSVPPELEVDILCRLRVKVLLRMRCVCKRWRRMIDSQSFVKAHLTRSLQSRENNFFILSKIRSDDLRSVDLDFLQASDELHHPLHHEARRIPRQRRLFQSRFQNLPERSQIIIPNWQRFISQYGMILVWGSCNGLVVMSTPSSACLWNPSTRKHLMLPNSDVGPSSLERPQDFYGFGYDSVTEDYKVVKISEYKNQTRADFQYQVWVFGLETNYWREIVTSFPPVMKCERQPGVLVGETLYWPVESHGDWILAFNLNTEEYRMLSHPQCEYPDYYSRLGTLNGRLCLMYSYLPVGYEVWVMEEHIDDDTWTRRTLQLGDFISYPGGFTRTTLDGTLHNVQGARAVLYRPPLLPTSDLYVKAPWHFGVEPTDHTDICTASLVSLEGGAAIHQ